MNIRVACPDCGRIGRLDAAKAADWQCPSCDRLLTLNGPAQESELRSCLICGNRELYKKKDFPHWLGLAILTAACLGSFVPYYYHRIWLTWVILIGSAAIDGLLYLWVGDAIVCYRCHAQFRGFETLPEHQPFDLGIGERYRQDQIRREQLKASRQ